jgi:hypothetical protein
LLWFLVIFVSLFYINEMNDLCLYPLCLTFCFILSFTFHIQINILALFKSTNLFHVPFIKVHMRYWTRWSYEFPNLLHQSPNVVFSSSQLCSLYCSFQSTTSLYLPDLVSLLFGMVSIFLVALRSISVMS